MSIKKPCYIWNECLINQCDRLPAVLNRATMVHDLLTAYGLNKHLKVIRPSPASYQDLKEFHSELYLNHLKTLVDISEDYETNIQDEEYGIGYDCPPIFNMYELVSVIAGGSITAAKCLLLGISNVAINWCGGWHHAQRFRADGFCYVNDIVVAIEKLRMKFKKILYIDLDVHHGNGVQDAFNLSKSVFTLSFHKYEPGFYPGSGGIDDIGSLTGKGYTCNFPLHAFYSDRTLEFAFGKIFPLVFSKFMPDAIVMQCGADALVNDPNGGACLTEHGYIMCVRKVLDVKKPTILLGGGGYKHSNAARLWARLTAVVIGVELDENIPEHDHWPKYGPDFLLPMQLSFTKDLNTEQYLSECVAKIKHNLKYIHNHLPPLKRKKYEIETGKLKLDEGTNKCDSIQNSQELSEHMNKERHSEELQGQVALLKSKTNKLDDVYDFHD